MSECADEPLVTNVGATSTSRFQVAPHSGTLRNGRLSQIGNIYLLTTCTHQRQPLFSDRRAGEIVLACMRHLHTSGQLESHACVVMPDHFHWLLTLRQGTLSAIMRSLKTFTAKQIARELGCAGVVWQTGFHDHTLRSEESLHDTARYLLANPIRAGLVTSLQDYPLIECQWGLIA